MASTRDRYSPDGKYKGTSVLWRDGAQQRSKMCRTPGEAEDFRKRIEAGVAAPAATDDKSLFGTFVRDVWLPGARYSPNTERAMRGVLVNDLAPLAARTVAWVASHRIEVMATISASKRSDHGLLASVVRGACDEAVNCGLIDSHKLAGLKVRRNTTRRDIIPTTADQRERIADGLGRCDHGRQADQGVAAGRCLGLAVWLMHGCGMRVSEVLGLRGSDFRDGFATVRVQRQAQGGAAAPLKHRRPGQFRDVPLPAWLARKVRAHVAEHGLGALFAGSTGREFASYSAIRVPLKRLSGECGLPATFSAHQFRHAFASTLLSEGLGIIEVAEWMGDGVKVMQETYAHVLPVATDRAREILDQAL